MSAAQTAVYPESSGGPLDLGSVLSSSSNQYRGLPVWQHVEICT